MELLNKINDKSAVVGIIGLGYVGLPLGLEFALKGFKVIGFDLDPKKPEYLAKGKTYIKHISEEKIKKAVESGKFEATTDFSRLPEADAVIICVPTPLDEHREPDMSFIVNSSKVIQKYLKKGQFVSLESTTYPGTTDEILLPMFEEAPLVQYKLKNEKLKEEEVLSAVSEDSHAGMEQAKAASNETVNNSEIKKFLVGEDFYLAFSPEREDPNNPHYSTATIPKVVGGITPKCLEIAQALYGQVIVKTVPVSSTRAAEATKILENVYRAVNIALVNELKMVFDRMDIDVWEVIEAAKTKPFGYNAFYPGPGLGGHCIPIDPFYLTWKAREYDINTKFIELAGEINTYQPYYVMERTMDIINRFKISLNGAKVLILGVAYKKNIDDMRESPSLKLIDIFKDKGAIVDYSDPYVSKLPRTRKYKFNMNSIHITKESLSQYDMVVLSTDHDKFDYNLIAEYSKIIIDCRNAFFKNGIISSKIFKV